MSYDHWKTTNPDDEWLGPDPSINEDEVDEPPEIHYPNAIRPFLDDGFDYRGHQVRYDCYVSKYDGCVLTQVLIDGERYHFEHRTQESAEAAAKRIIDRF